MVNLPVLILNQNYEPLNVCQARRAVVLVWRGKAEVLETDSATLHSATLEVTVPSVIRLVYLIRRPPPHRKLTRHEVFLRDNHTCQYCGRQTRDLTLDHVLPRHLGGKHVWDNIVSACQECNHRKAGRHPAEARMKLSHPPAPPTTPAYYSLHHRYLDRPGWQKYMPQQR